MFIFSLTKCEMLLSMSGKLCLRHCFRIHVLLYKCIVHVCFVYHVCVRYSLGLMSVLEINWHVIMGVIVI